MTYVPKKTRDDVYRYFFVEGVVTCKKDPLGTWEGELGGKKFHAPALSIWYLMRSMKSRGLIKEQFAWRQFYWYLNDEGVNYLRKYLHLAETVVPNTHKKSAKEDENLERMPERRGRGGARGGRGGRGFGRGRGGYGADREQYQQGEGQEGGFRGRGRGGRGRGFGRGRGGQQEGAEAPAAASE